jgi:hypothetical protein
MPTEGHLCAVQAIAEWITASRITTGYLFRKFASGDRIAEANQPLVSLPESYIYRESLIQSYNLDFRTVSGAVSQQSPGYWGRPLIIWYSFISAWGLPVSAY